MTENRILGCIVGGAIGDAFGGLYEGGPPHKPISNHQQLNLSDDTQLTLATCEAIIEQGGRVVPSAIAEKFAQWYRESRITGIGASTQKALSELAAGGHWALVGRKGDRAAGNGAAMRAAPLAFCLDPHKSVDRRTIRDVSRITHHHEEAYAGTLAIAIAIHAAYNANWDSDESLIELVIDALPDTQVRDRLISLSKLAPDISIAEIGRTYGSSGYVADSVPLALIGAQRINRIGFAKLIDQLIAVGGDTDTIASMAGQVAGILIGYDQLPKEMISRLSDREQIEGTAREFAVVLNR
ncbi:MAG TPA: ADP-ribosylglycohydrolase family protein [Blastocatellia bacterium]|nr:ADP-ribosylglycohydrolase family protein [Blastocatellia bacterium]